ncbi:PREDICTED: mammaglobin-A-like [Elephantulus edwardii]|uniref:mammaglobin-A-like n=1 Tax=Elephantulus edwardii TaxID=28737 RepID=UPI0003F07A8D|nr:PREDICTED: mammaglobin-A-like [Elephantulus edwardii]
MKLVLVLLLAALPLYCCAGTSCKLLKNAVDWTIDPKVSKEEYTDNLKAFIRGDQSLTVLQYFKQCYLKQPQEVLDPVNNTMELGEDGGPRGSRLVADNAAAMSVSQASAAEAAAGPRAQQGGLSCGLPPVPGKQAGGKHGSSSSRGGGSGASFSSASA